MTDLNLESLVAKVAEEVRPIRRDIHANPELGYQEFRTSRLVRDWLQGLGLKVRSPVAETGVIGLLEGGRAGRTIAFRADMDALPIQEAAGASYSSTKSGISHACGHDGHTSIVLGLAKVLRSIKDEIPGNVKFIFQPAEEGGGGGRRMCEEGALEDPHVDAIFALHDWPNLPVGSMGYRYGVMMANSDPFEVEVIGKGGHAAHPDKTVDPVLIAAKLVENLQAIVSRQRGPFSPVVVTIGKIWGGTAPNIIPDRVSLAGTFRTLDQETRSMVMGSIRKIAEGTCGMYNGRAEVSFKEGYPVTLNHDKAVDLAVSVANRVLGQQSVHRLQYPSMGGEDFSFYLQRVPGAILRLGIVGRSGEHGAWLHTPEFDFNDDALNPGIALLANIALEFLMSS